ncbi:hypothetical protein Q7P37_006722 [Cladosporium fusiforme]
MEHNDEEDDVRLAKASAGLLTDLELHLPKLLWKSSRRDNNSHDSVHSRVRRKDLDYIINLIEPFQGEPHLLDTKLKSILPPIIDAYLDSLLKPTPSQVNTHLDIRTALATILYTLCKVRGAKVIVGFFNNEPRYLEPILSSLEDVASGQHSEDVDWKVPYVLLLWLSHLLLTPFDLASISATPVDAENQQARLRLPDTLPPVAQRIVRMGIEYLSASTKAQDAAAAMLVRLATRPDMQRIRLGDVLVDYAIGELSPDEDLPSSVYQQLGPLRFLAGVATSADLGHLIPNIYRACQRLADDDSASPVASNAVGKKLTVKMFRNIAILTLRSSSISGPLLSFLETTGVLEDVIDHLLQSLGDRDTPVRYAAAKAISLIISELESEMGHEVIQAVLDTFKEDMPRSSSGIDYQTVNALKWHGLTLTLSHALFKRSASPSQLPDILEALVSALNFEQRTATGSSIGTNVRDAANFGIWSLSRRYTSDELSSVDAQTLRFTDSKSTELTVIQAMATQLLLSACLDPAGNIRRGSSAALQELIGRHPNHVIEGISVVQIVDYQAVGLRKRALVDVAGKAAALHQSYWQALVSGLIMWRGLRSVDVVSREAAADSLANLVSVSVNGNPENLQYISELLLANMEESSSSDIESLHGLLCSFSSLLLLQADLVLTPPLHRRFWDGVRSIGALQVDFNPRSLKSEFPVSLARLATEVCRHERRYISDHGLDAAVIFPDMDSVVQRLLVRHEDSILHVLPGLSKQLYHLRKLTSEPLGCIDIPTLVKAVKNDGSRAVLSGAGRAIALGTTAAQNEDGLMGEEPALAVSTLAGLTTAMNVEWRVVGLRALHLALLDLSSSRMDPEILATIVHAMHTGMTDHTIDERGDIGSLVRLQALICVSCFLALNALAPESDNSQLLQSDILRLSHEKLDRVRGRAAACRQQHFPNHLTVQHTDNINSEAYLRSAFAPIFNPSTAPWALRALIEGTISCAGISGESLLQTSRSILTQELHATSPQHLHTLLTIYTETLRSLLLPSTPNATNLQPAALDLLAFLLDMRIPQRLTSAQTTFKWRTLLSTVQKSHHKSSDVPKLLCAINVYIGLAEVPSIRGEVVKKLLSMLATNPYPRVRVAVAEAVYAVLDDVGEMKGLNWTEKGAPQQSQLLEELRRRFVEGGV